MVGKGKKGISASMGMFAVVFLILMVTVFLPQEKIIFALEEGSLTVSHTKTTVMKKEADLSRTVVLSNAAGLRLVEKADLGQVAEEAEINTKKCVAGIWKSDQLGEFDVIIYKSVPVYVWIEVPGERPFLMNLENKELTESFCESLEKYKHEKGEEAVTERETEIMGG